MPKKIHVFYRHCFHSIHQQHPSRQRPVWFNKEKVYQNFLRTLDLNYVDYTIVYDEKFGPIQDTFLKYEKNVAIISAGAEALSFLALLNLIKEKNFSGDQIIYLLEDDYVHRDGWVDVMLEGFTLPVHYVTLYDPSEKYDYTRNANGGILRLLLSQTHHWALLANTTNTFATRWQTLLDDLELQKKYSIFSDPALQASSCSLDVDKWVELLAKGRNLACPIPGWSTHCQEGNLTPCVNWGGFLR